MELIVFALPVALIAVGYLVPGLTSPGLENKKSVARIGVPSETPCQAC